jgi:hypothetical protein
MTMLIATTFICVLLGTASIFAVLKLAFAG